MHLVQFRLDNQTSKSLNKMAQHQYGLSGNQLLKVIAHQLVHRQGQDVLSQDPFSYANILPSDNGISDQQFAEKIEKHANDPSIPIDNFFKDLEQAGKKHFDSQTEEVKE